MTGDPWRKQRVYIAGPMQDGDLMVNVRRAIDDADNLRFRGFVTVVPHLSVFDHLIHDRKYETWMREDWSHIRTCGSVLRIPGESAGADREDEWANQMGVDVYHSIAALIDGEWTAELEQIWKTPPEDRPPLPGKVLRLSAPETMLSVLTKLAKDVERHQGNIDALFDEVRELGGI